MGTLQVSLGDDLNNWDDAQSDLDNGQRSLSDKMTMTDFMQVVCNIKLGVADTLSMSDNFGAGGYALAQALADTLSMDDALALQNNINLTVTLADTMNRLSDTLGTTDSGEIIDYLRRYLNDK